MSGAAASRSLIAELVSGVLLEVVRPAWRRGRGRCRRHPCRRPGCRPWRRQTPSRARGRRRAKPRSGMRQAAARSLITSIVLIGATSFRMSAPAQARGACQQANEGWFGPQGNYRKFIGGRRELPHSGRVPVRAGGADRVLRGAAVCAVLAVLFLTFLDTTIVSVTLGNVQYDLGAGVIPLQWVVNAYSLVFASLMLVAGSLGDRFGRRRLMVAGIAVFCVGSLVCALASGRRRRDRRPGGDGRGRGGVRAGHAVGDPAALPRPPASGPGRSAPGRRCPGSRSPLGPVLGGAAGRRRRLARGVLVQPRARRRAAGRGRAARAGELATRSRAASTSAGSVLGAVALGCADLRRDLRRAVRLRHLVGRRAVRRSAAAGAVAFLAVERRVAAPMLDPRVPARPRGRRAALFVAFAVYFGVFAIFFLTALYLDIGGRVLGRADGRLFAPMAVAIVRRRRCRPGGGWPAPGRGGRWSPAASWPPRRSSSPARPAGRRARLRGLVASRSRSPGSVSGWPSCR